MREIAFAIFLFALFTGCNRTAGQQQQQQRLAIDRVHELQTAFNTGKCQTFYERSGMRKDESKVEWIGGCERMREALGKWQSLDLITVLTIPGTKPSALQVEGLARFQNGDHVESYWLESYWHITDSDLRLEYFYLEGGGKEFALPRLRKPWPKPNLDKRDTG